MSDIPGQDTASPFRTNAARGDLTRGPVKKHLIRLSLPMVWGIAAIISFQLVDTFYVSMLGTGALAAISFTFPVSFTLFSLIMGFGIAMSSVVSRLIGEGNRELVRRVATHGLALVFMLSIVLALVGLVLHDQVFRLMGAEGEMLALIGDYMKIWLIGIVFLALPMVGNSAIRAGGDTFTPAMIMTIVAFVNIILDPILIFGLFGFPRMELQGAALATVFANACAMAAGLYVLYVREKILAPALALKRISEFGDSARRLLHIALPAGLAYVVSPVVGALIVALLSAYGPAAVAAYGVVTRIEAFAFVILMGVAVGMAPIIGQNWGAKNFARVHEALRLALGFSVLWSLFLALVLGIFARPIAGLFSQDPDVIDTIALFFRIVPFAYAFMNLVRGWISAFNAMGKPHRAFVMVMLETAVLMVPAVLLGNYWGGVAGIFTGIAATYTLSGLAIHIWSWRACRADERKI